MFVWSRYSVGILTEVVPPSLLFALRWRIGVLLSNKPTDEEELRILHTKSFPLLKPLRVSANQITRQQIKGRRALWFLWREKLRDLDINGIYSNFISILAFCLRIKLIKLIQFQGIINPPCFNFKINLMCIKLRN